MDYNYFDSKGKYIKIFEDSGCSGGGVSAGLVPKKMGEEGN